MPKKMILAVIDGLGPAVLDQAIAAGRAPALARLQELGSRTDACVSTFPSLTPVCLSALITGEHPVGTRIPSMTWYHRGEGRFVEYGSSFLATLAEGTKQMVDDVMVNLNLLHLSPRATTVFEALEDRGLVTAAVNTYICRGRVRHPIARHAARRIARRVGIVDAIYGPRRYFFGELFWSDETGAPRNFGGSVDRHGGHVARWLVTRDGFDFLFLYMYETDAAGHRGGDVMAAVEQADRGIGLVVDAAGGWHEFLERYAIAVVADHGQSTVERVVDAAEPFDDLRLFRSSRHSDPAACDLAVGASNRVAMAYLLPGGTLTASEVAHRFARHPASDVVIWREGAWFAVRREGGELRFRQGSEHRDERGNGWDLAGDRDLLDPALYPNAFERIAGAASCATAGDVIVSARPGDEFADAGGQHHAGGGSHGSLHAGDSFVPLITAGFEEPTGLGAMPSITDLTPLALRHFPVAERASRTIVSSAG
jgi:predicted AlkP superfamily pyrophosphatase or phosphodiesterase